ncbi:MAG: helix-turn-helix domain-containing protein [Haliscomenobacter sp.]|nr:helix-turn-helix domain-containing protein [Haliscomenobacter sp.]
MINWDYFRNIDFSYTGISAFLGTIFGLFLIFKPKDKFYLNVLLGFIFIAFARFLAFSPLFKNNYQFYLENAIITRPFYFLIPPVLYFYVSFRLSQKLAWEKRDLYHLIPFFLFALDTSVFVFSPQGVKNNLLISIGIDYKVLFNGQVGIFSSSIFYLGILLQFHIYQVYLIRYFFKYLYFLRDLYFNWSLFLVFSVSAIFLTIEVRTFYIYIMTTFSPGIFQNLFFTVNKTICLIFFNGIWISYLIRYIIPLFKNQEEAELADYSIPQKKEKQLLTDELEAIELKLNEFFNSSTLLFDSSFNINRLATEIGVPSNVLTKYFNQFLGMRYNHAINKIRIEKLLEMVESDNNILKHITMEAIGNKIGFSSKSSFYAAFSREMGCTPAEYFSRKHE